MGLDEGDVDNAAYRLFIKTPLFSERVGVAAATVIRWHDQRRSTGTYAAKPQGGDTRSRRIEAYRETVLRLHEARRDITLDELRRELGHARLSSLALAP